MAFTAPSLFISHGAPTIALHPESDYAGALTRFGKEFLTPCKGIVVMSAHWALAGPIQILSVPSGAKVQHDFKGFQRELYDLQYPANGSREIANKISSLLALKNIKSEVIEDRRFDHGVWMPLLFLKPEADVPVIQISLPVGNDPREVLHLGKILSQLRHEGIAIMGSGGSVHNLQKLAWHNRQGALNARALEFETWLKRNLLEANIEKLLAFAEEAPSVDFAHPTHEHLMPFFFALGASVSENKLKIIYEGFEYETLSMLCFALCASSD